MKTLGIILIVIGIAMIIIRGVSVPTQKKVVDIGSRIIRFLRGSLVIAVSLPESGA